MRLARPAATIATTLLIAAPLAGCGDTARHATTKASPLDKHATQAVPPKSVRDETADMQGWTSTSWSKLGGRPKEWPVDLVPPLDTERATIVQQDDTAGLSTILNGRSPSQPTDTQSYLTDQFEGWKPVEGVGVEDVVGTYERGKVHAQVTVRKDGETGSTWGIILRAT